MGAEHPILTLFLAEAKSGKATKRSLAAIYALMIAGEDHIVRGDWTSVNGAIIALFGRAGLASVKRMAWDIHNAAAIRQQAQMLASSEASEAA
jgi:hypothetical protein